MYWAAAPGDEIAGILEELVEDFVKETHSLHEFDLMRRAYRMYYGEGASGFSKSDRITDAGENGEFALMTENDFRAYIKHVLNMTTSQRPALECRAANTDAKSLEQCQLGDQLLEWYMREKKYERHIKEATELACFLSEGYLSNEWVPTAGGIYTYRDTPEGRRPVFNGDMVPEVFTPLDIVRDLDRKDAGMPWHMAIRWKNRWNLAAKHEKMAEEIINVDADMIWKHREYFLHRHRTMKPDLIPEITFVHEKCEALPEGRMVKFLTADIKLFDGPLPYEEPQLWRISASDKLNTPFGYSFAFDMMGPMEAVNLMDSIILTNLKTFGVGVVKAPPGHNMDYQQLADGLSFIEVNEANGKLEAINMAAVPPEIFRFREEMRGPVMEFLSGINSVIKGNPDHNITSGSFAALLASNAIQFNSDLQQSYAQLCEDVGNSIIGQLQTFAKTDRVAKIAGKNNRYKLETFNKDSISEIKRVVVDLANPISKTTAGRLQLAKDMLDAGFVKRPEQYIQVMETGQMDPLFQHEVTELNNIERENEMIMGGDIPIAVVTDNHPLHIAEHKSLMDNPEIRANPQLVKACTEHMLQHWKLWRNADPAMLAALNIPPAPMSAPPGGPQGPAPNPGPMMDPNAPPLATPAPTDMPAMPNMPTDPLTGQQVGTPPPNQPPLPPQV